MKNCKSKGDEILVMKKNIVVVEETNFLLNLMRKVIEKDEFLSKRRDNPTYKGSEDVRIVVATEVLS